LVVIAVIVLPIVLNSEPVGERNDISVRMPQQAEQAEGAPRGSTPISLPAGRAAPFQEELVVAPAQPGPATNGVASPVAIAPLSKPDLASSSSSLGERAPPLNKSNSGPLPSVERTPFSKPMSTPLPSGEGVSLSQSNPAPLSSAEIASPSKPNPAPSKTAEPAKSTDATKPAAKKPAPPGRTDDGRRALALLEGHDLPKSSPSPSAEVSSQVVVQLAAYSLQQDAQARRDKLYTAGVTNAYVQKVTVAGKQQYRLRVGPFASRAAAHAAQAHLRTLGYDHSFIVAA
jgi:DedD protein